jgi:integrase
VVNNFTRQFGLILAASKVKNGKFHDIRRTAITLWFSNGMSENDVMVLAGHSNFATTHDFYLAVANDLVARARRASAQNLSSIFGANWCKGTFVPETEKAKDL